VKLTNPKLIAAAIFCVAASAGVRADVIPTLTDITPSNTNFQWNYDVNVTAKQTVNTGDYFTIYDFGSIIPNSATAPAGWTLTTNPIGVTPSKVSPTDNPGVLNLTWTYTGANPIAGASDLGLFSVATTTNQIRTGDFTGFATLNQGPQAGSKVSNVGNVAVPVPEASALFPLVGLAAAVGFTALLRRSRAAARS
jgi:hypothetical protein